ncbi:MAG: hypothetical protein ACMZ64_07295 [Oleiphilus sp.]
MTNKEDSLNHLAELTEAPLPLFMQTLPEENQAELAAFIDDVIDRREAGLDKLFESMSMMMKFVPNFILHSITPKYIAPSIAARIAQKLSTKQALGVTSGLPADYIGETAAYMEKHIAAEILSGIKKNKVEAVLSYIVANHPLKALDISEQLDNSLLKLMKSYAASAFPAEETLSPARRQILLAIKQA